MSDEWKEVVAEWCGDMVFEGRNASGGIIQMGSREGQPGISPMEMLLLGTAGCTAMDIVWILNKKRRVLTRFEVRVRGKRSSDYPQIYTDIEVAYHLWGTELKTSEIEQAIQLSEEKYCSVSAMLRRAATIRSSYVLHPDEEVAAV